MSEILNTWQFNVIAYIFFIVLFFQFYKLAVKHAKNDGAATVVIQTLGALSMVLLIPFFAFPIPYDALLYILTFAACMFFALTDRLQTTIRKHLDVASVSVLDQLTTVFLIIYGFTLFQEPILVSKIVGTLLIIFGNAYIFFQAGKFTINKYALLSVLSTASMATAFTIDIGISEKFNLPFYIFLTFIIPAILIALIQRLPISKIKNEFTLHRKRYYLITGVSWGLAIFFSLRSFQFGDVTTIVPIQATAVLVNVLVATFVFRETTDIKKKVIAAMLVIIGVYVTTMNF